MKQTVSAPTTRGSVSTSELLQLKAKVQAIVKRLAKFISSVLEEEVSPQRTLQIVGFGISFLLFLGACCTDSMLLLVLSGIVCFLKARKAGVFYKD